MATELAQAYITLIPSLKGAQGVIERQLSGINTAMVGKGLGSGMLSGFDASGAMSSIGGKINSTFGRAAKVGVGAVASIGTALAGLAATGGLSRAMNMERAQQMFKGLKLEWSQYKDTINDAVTGTAFSLDEAAVVAAGLAASGVSAGEQMSKSLNAAVGAAATFGTGLNEIGNIFQKVAAKGKLQGDEIMMLTERGVPALQILSQYLGKTGDEISEMVRKGEIDFQTFSDAMYASFGDAAQGANNTFVGSLANVRNALNRLGEKFEAPAMKALVPVFNSTMGAINAVSGRCDGYALGGGLERRARCGDKAKGGGEPGDLLGPPLAEERVHGGRQRLHGASASVDGASEHID